MSLALHTAARRSLSALSLGRRSASDLLQKLKLGDHNDGVFDGAWTAGKGETVESLNPCNNEVLATVSQVRPPQGGREREGRERRERERERKMKTDPRKKSVH